LEQLRESTLDKKVLIVISDGGDNASTHTLNQVLNLAEQSSAIVYTIGIYDEDDPDRNPHVLRRLARSSGGEAFFPERVTEVVDICTLIARDVRNQYTIGYVPKNPTRNAGHRTIRVVAQGPGQGRLFVRTRTGYIAQRAGQEKNENTE
jgi:VWFA-related protein